MFQSLMVMTVKLISPPLQLTTPSPNLQCLTHLHNFLDFPLLNADGIQHERSETSWMRSPLWPLVHDHPDPQSPGNSKRAKHRESVNIAVELFPNGCEGSTNLPAGWHYDPKTHEIYLGSTAIFGALKMDFWLETMSGQGIALFIQQIFPCLPRSSRPQMA